LSNERYHALPTTSTSGLQLVAKVLDDVGPVHLDGGNRAMVPRLTYHEFTDAGVLQEQHRYRLLMCQHNDELGIGHRIHINILERGLRLTAGGILGGADLTLDEDEVDIVTWDGERFGAPTSRAMNIHGKQHGSIWQLRGVDVGQAAGTACAQLRE